MKIGVLAMSYAAPGNISLLADYFGDAVEMYVHYDRKLDPTAIQAVDRVRVVSPSRQVYWGGWSMVETMFDLIRAAQQHSDPDRYVLISDDSAPLMPIGELWRKLAEPKDRIWAEGSAADWVQSRYANFYCFDHAATTARCVDPAERAVDPALLAAMGEAQALMAGRGKKPTAIRHGPQWWALTRDTVLRILASDRDDEWLRSSFRFSAVPDEMYIHSLLAAEVTEPFMFTDFQGPIRPWRFDSLAEIRARDTDGHLFIRKVDATVPEIAALMRSGQLD